MWSRSQAKVSQHSNNNILYFEYILTFVFDYCWQFAIEIIGLCSASVSVFTEISRIGGHSCQHQYNNAFDNHWFLYFFVHFAVNISTMNQKKQMCTVKQISYWKRAKK